MSSQAPTQASWRRSSPAAERASPREQQASKENLTVESESRPINNIPELKTAPENASQAPQVEVPEPKRCWICQMDDTEDTPEDSEWRNPCPCSLTAHDSCLLAWIADKETPKPDQIVTDSKIKCPVCDAEIKILRPRDPLVDLYGTIQRAANSLILPTAISGLFGCLYSGLMVYGLNTVLVVFGLPETRLLLQDQMRLAPVNSQGFQGLLGRTMHMMDPFFPVHTVPYKLFFALPLIGPSLILLRTGLADQASALILPIYFFANPTTFPRVPWPPPPGLTFAFIPFLKKTYNLLYTHTFADLEASWDRAVQRKPREGETEDEIRQAAVDDEGRAIIDLEWVHEVNDAPAPPRPQVAVDANGIPLEQQGGVVLPAAQPQVVNRWALHQDISSAKIATTVMGALFFPAISSMMGELLKIALPARFVRYSVGGRGLLKEKWGRTVVGGALFVVLKDVVTLYCKWKRATDFGKRKVLDYTGTRGAGQGRI